LTLLKFRDLIHIIVVVFPQTALLVGHLFVSRTVGSHIQNTQKFGFELFNWRDTRDKHILGNRSKVEWFVRYRVHHEPLKVKFNHSLPVSLLNTVSKDRLTLNAVGVFSKLEQFWCNKEKVLILLETLTKFKILPFEILMVVLKIEFSDYWFANFCPINLLRHFCIFIDAGLAFVTHHKIKVNIVLPLLDP